MKKLELKFGSLKEMLTKQQMQMISGGDVYDCNVIGSVTEESLPVPGDNCCQAQAACDYLAWASGTGFPSGGDVPCDMDCN